MLHVFGMEVVMDYAAIQYMSYVFTNHENKDVEGWKFSGCGPFGNVGNNVLQSAITIDLLNYYEWWASWDEWLSVRWLDQLVEQLTGAFTNVVPAFARAWLYCKYTALE